MADAPKGNEVHVYVPKGSGKDVKVVEVDDAPGGNEITLRVSRERKPKTSNAVGVIVK